MSYRSETKGNDRQIFHATGTTTKKINIAPKTMRGGIRL